MQGKYYIILFGGIASVVQPIIQAFPVKFVTMVLELVATGNISEVTKKVKIDNCYSSVVFALLVYLKDANTWLSYKPIAKNSRFYNRYYEKFTGTTFPYAVEKLLKKFGFTNVTSTIDLSNTIPILSKILSSYPCFRASKRKHFNSKYENLKYVIKRIEKGSYCIMLGRGNFFLNKKLSELSYGELLKLIFAHYVAVEKLENVNGTVNLCYADNWGKKKYKEISLKKFLPHYYGCIVADAA